MDSKKLTKAERRKAAEREKLKRNEEAEAKLEAIVWETDSLTESVRTNGARIGGRLLGGQHSSTLDLVRFGIEWPKGVVFDSSTELYHKYLLSINAEDYKNLSEYELQDQMPFCLHGFKFVDDARVGFWPGWEKEFTGVDSEKLFPFGADNHYFFFVRENPDSPQDPEILKVDHEDVSEEPYCPEFGTLGELLVALVRQ